MNKREAREILQLFRPGTKDAEDPQIAEALQFAQQDEELASWFAGHCSLYVTMRSRLKEIPVPADLQARILRDEAQRRGRIVDFRKWLLPLAAAAMVLLLAGGSWLAYALIHRDSFGDYREKMAKVPQRGYSMTMFSTNLNAIHTYLLNNQCPDYVLTKPLTTMTGMGCATLEWRARKVSMVCLMDKATKKSLFLFAMDRGTLRNAPESSEPQFEQVRELMTASWTVGDKVYVLAGEGSESDLKRYLN